MPHHKSTVKRLRQSKVQRTYNRAVRSEVRNAIKSAKGASGDAAQESLSSAYSTLDVAVKKGVLKRSYVARMKSRLAQHVKRSA